MRLVGNGTESQFDPPLQLGSVFQGLRPTLQEGSKVWSFILTDPGPEPLRISTEYGFGVPPTEIAESLRIEKTELYLSPDGFVLPERPHGLDYKPGLFASGDQEHQGWST